MFAAAVCVIVSYIRTNQRGSFVQFSVFVVHNVEMCDVIESMPNEPHTFHMYYNVQVHGKPI